MTTWNLVEVKNSFGKFKEGETAYLRKLRDSDCYCIFDGNDRYQVMTEEEVVGKLSSCL